MNLKRGFGLAAFLFSFFAVGVFNCHAQNNLAALAETLRRGDAEQKRDALFEVKKLKTEAASRVALSALSDKSEIVRATAAAAVIFLPPDEAAQNLLPLLRDKSVLVRKETAYALGATKNPNAARPLVELIRQDKIQEVKDAAIVALGTLGDVSAIDALTQILRRQPRDEEEFARRAAARSIGQIAQIIQAGETSVVTPENFLPDKFKATTKPIYKNLAETFPQFRAALPILLAALQNPREADDARRESAFALGTIGDAAAVAALQNQLAAEDYYLAEIAGEALQKLSARRE